jgi:stress-induced morphogen
VIEPERLRTLLTDAFSDAVVELSDLTGTRDHYELHIASDRFVGMAPVGRHRLVYAVLGEHMRGDIHALSLFTYTSSEWQKRGSTA